MFRKFLLQENVWIFRCVELHSDCLWKFICDRNFAAFLIILLLFRLHIMSHYLCSFRFLNFTFCMQHESGDTEHMMQSKLSSSNRMQHLCRTQSNLLKEAFQLSSSDFLVCLRLVWFLILTSISFRCFSSTQFLRSDIHSWWILKSNASFWLIMLRVIRLDFILKILSIAYSAFRFSFSMKNSEFSVWLNDFSSF